MIDALVLRGCSIKHVYGASAMRLLRLLCTSALVLGVATLASHSFAELEPRQVSKHGAIDVPPGMHLMTDRAGLRWLLPDDMDEPPDREIAIKYFKASQTPSVIKSIGRHQVLSGPISALETVVSTQASDPTNLMSMLPKSFAETLVLEKQANLHAQTSADLLSLGVFAPNQFTTFLLPYIPIPKSEMEFAHVSSYASNATRELVEFNDQGVECVRFFILPNYVDSYADLIKKHGIVYHYQALTTSSPRSLIVVDPDHPQNVHWVKPSLHRKIDGSVRINTDKKARRAIIMSEAIEAVPDSVLRSYGLRFMLEPAAFQPKGKLSSTIHREVAPELLHPAPGTKWVPAFVLQNTGTDAVPGLNIEDMSRVAQVPVEVFVREKLVRPLLRSYLSMGLLEGLPGELHTQNFYYELKEVNGGWRPTGEVMFKDNDGFRYDTELALRRGRNMKFFAEFDEPFVWGKFSNTLGLGAEGLPFLGSWYYKLIRNVAGFETLAAYMLRAINSIDPSRKMTKDEIQRLFDDVAAEEAGRLTAVQLLPSDYGFQDDKGLNKVLSEWRERRALEQNIAQSQDSDLQMTLAKQWQRLEKSGRVSALRRSLTKDAYYLLHRAPDDALIIEARVSKLRGKADPVIGFAMVEAIDTPAGQSAHAELIPRLEKFEKSALAQQILLTPREAPKGSARENLCRELF